MCATGPSKKVKVKKLSRKQRAFKVKKQREIEEQRKIREAGFKVAA